MSFKAVLAAQALAIAAFAGVVPLDAAPADPVCSHIPPSFPHQSAAVSSYCSAYFTHTSTAYTTATAGTTTVGSTVTYTPTTTSYIDTATCFTPNSLPTKFPHKREAAPAFGGPADQPISTACSCYGVSVHPTSTVTTKTTTTYSATVTDPASTSTYTAHGPFQAKATAYVVPSGFYGSPAGATFNEYRDHDFYGNDLYNGFCGTGGFVNTPYGNVPCDGFESCENSCAVYNDANAAHGFPHQQCIGVSFEKSISHCWLKYAMEDCNPEPNANVDSGLLTHGA